MAVVGIRWRLRARGCYSHVSVTILSGPSRQPRSQGPAPRCSQTQADDRGRGPGADAGAHRCGARPPAIHRNECGCALGRRLRRQGVSRMVRARYSAACLPRFSPSRGFRHRWSDRRPGRSRSSEAASWPEPSWSREGDYAAVDGLIFLCHNILHQAWNTFRYSRLPSFVRPARKRLRIAAAPAACGRSAASADAAWLLASSGSGRRACSPGGTTNGRGVWRCWS